MHRNEKTQESRLPLLHFVFCVTFLSEAMLYQLSNVCILQALIWISSQLSNANRILLKRSLLNSFLDGAVTSFEQNTGKLRHSCNIRGKTLHTEELNATKEMYKYKLNQKSSAKHKKETK